MKWIFYWEDEGKEGENSFIIEAEDHEEALYKAFDSYGPQVYDMYYELLRTLN